MNRRRLSRWIRAPWPLVAALLMLAAGPARALCLGPICNCSVSTTAVMFGAYQPLLGASVDSTGAVQVACGGVAGLLIPYKIDLGGGGSGNIAARRLSGPGTLGYQLYTDATRSTVWGNGSSGASVNGSILLDALGLSPPVRHTVYGRIPGGQSGVPPGTYADTLTVTLTYY